MAQVGVARLGTFAVVVSALFAVDSAKTIAWRSHPDDSSDAEYVARVRQVADPRCVVAGDGRLYVRYFADYPFFISARPTEVSYAMLYYGSASAAEYWEIKSPEVIAWKGELPPGLAAYAARHQLPKVADGLWITDSCVRR